MQSFVCRVAAESSGDMRTRKHRDNCSTSSHSSGCEHFGTFNLHSRCFQTLTGLPWNLDYWHGFSMNEFAKAWKMRKLAPLETCDFWDIWSKWWGDMTWPTKDNDKYNEKDKDNDNWRTPSKNNPRDSWHWHISDNWEQQSKHSQWPLNKEWQGQHSQFLRCFAFSQ